MTIIFDFPTRASLYF